MNGIKASHIVGILSLVLIIVFGIGSCNYRNNSIVKEKITFYAENDIRKESEKMFSDSTLQKYFDIQFVDDAKGEVDFILTQDISNINQEKDYKNIGYSPLICLMKDTKDLNNLLTSNTKQGFLISSKKINNNKDDKIKCDFSKVIEVVVSGGDWSDLGGSDKEIKIYCPDLKTTDGKLFKEFVYLTLNNGSKEINKEVEAKVDKFFASSNVVQTDVVEKLKMLGTKPLDTDIYIMFEEEYLSYRYDNRESEEERCLTMIYPDTTIVKNTYFQSNIEKEKITDKFTTYHYYAHCYYRATDMSYGDECRLYDSEYFYYCNTQEGINAF